MWAGFSESAIRVGGADPGDSICVRRQIMKCPTECFLDKSVQLCKVPRLS
jgi:hypothetical protein